MKRKSSVILTLLMTLALIISLVAIPANAATPYTAIGGETTFTTNLVVDKDATIPSIEFAYTIAPGTAVAPTNTTIEILKGPAGATVSNAIFTGGETTTDGTPTDTEDTTHKYAAASTPAKVTFPAGGFDKPGVYRYIVTPTASTELGVTTDTTTRYIDVFVTANGSDVLSISKVVCRSGDPKNINLADGKYADDPAAAAKSAGYTNEIKQYDLIFNKTIAGNQGDKNKKFTFTLSIKDAIPGTYTLATTDVTGNPTSITVPTGGTYTGTFELTNGSSVTVKGLNSGAKYTISEENQDYTAAYTINGGTSTTGKATPTDAVLSADTTAAFTNTRDGIIPTGIIIAVAPYVIGLCLFGAVVIFMLGRKKRQSAEEN